MKTLLTAYVLLFFTGMLNAASLDDSRSKYGASTNKIALMYLVALDEAQAACLKSLTSLQSFYRSKGRLEDTLAMEKITESFRASKSLPDDFDSERLKELVAIGDKLDRSKETAGAVRDEQTYKLLSNYVKHLVGLQKKLVLADNIKEAQSAKSERLAKELELKAVQTRIQAYRQELKFRQAAGRSGIPSGLRQGLILHAKLDRREKEKVRDWSGKKNDGMIKDAIWTAKGKVGGAYQFDGNGYIEFGSLGPFPDEGAIAFWMFPDVVENHRNPFTTKRAGGNAAFRFEENSEGGFGIAAGDDGGHFEGHAITKALKAGTWGHVLVVWNRKQNNLKGYFNGKLVFDDMQNQWPTIYHNVAIGTGFSTGGERQWKGKIDELMIWTRTISESEIRHLYRLQHR